MAKKKNNEIMGSHQRCWVWGKHAVGEILRAGRWSMAELYLDRALPPDTLAATRRRAAELGIPIIEEEGKRLVQLGRAKDHQGFLAKMRPFPYAECEEVLARLIPQSGPDAPLLLVLDAIQDPYNFGAILRSAEVLGVSAVIVGERNQAEVNSLVGRASAGAVNRLDIVRTPDLPAILARLAKMGFHIVGTSEKADKPCTEHNFLEPAALILGNEAHGISPSLEERCGTLLRIPQAGEIGSLNVAAAAAILLYEAGRQKDAARPQQPLS